MTTVSPTEISGYSGYGRVTFRPYQYRTSRNEPPIRLVLVSPTRKYLTKSERSERQELEFRRSSTPAKSEVRSEFYERSTERQENRESYVRSSFARILEVILRYRKGPAPVSRPGLCAFTIPDPSGGLTGGCLAERMTPGIPPGIPPASPARMVAMGTRASRPGWHHLDRVDEQARTGVCVICGPTDVARNGPGWMCGNKKRDLRASYYNRVQRKSEPSPHALTWRSLELKLGLCPIDGEVDILPVARGWSCGPHARELKNWRRVPALQCGVCGGFDSRHNPVLSPTELQGAICEACATLMRNGPERRMNPEVQMAAVFTTSTDSQDQMGAHVVSHFDLLNPEYMPDTESAVAGWKTLGATD